MATFLCFSLNKFCTVTNFSYLWRRNASGTVYSPPADVIDVGAGTAFKFVA